LKNIHELYELNIQQILKKVNTAKRDPITGKAVENLKIFFRFFCFVANDRKKRYNENRK